SDLSDSVTLPVANNEYPQLSFREFASYKVGATYRKILNTADRRNYGEFWLRIGESFRLKAELSDAAGLRRYVINRVKRDGSRAVEYEYTYSVACPEPLIRHELKTSEIVFNQSEPTEYEVLLEDNAGQITRRAFLIHPLANVVPEIRITTPAEGQYIAAGTFRVKINIVASDDRELTTDNLDIFANGVRLDLIESLDGEPGGKEV